MAVALYAHLADHAGKDRAIYPGRKKLAERLHVSQASIDRLMRELKTLQAVTIKPRYGKDGDQLTNEYLLRQIPPSSPVTPPLFTGDEGSLSTRDQAPSSRVTNKPNKSDPDLSPSERADAPNPGSLGVAAPEWLSQLWNEKAGNGVPKTLSLSKTRQRLAQAAWRSHPDPAWWRATLDRAHLSRFLRGAKGWRMNFDWFVKGDNALRVSEGVHDNRPGDNRAEYEKAQTIINRAGGRCSHDPMCADRDEHLERVVDRLLGLSPDHVE